MEGMRRKWFEAPVDQPWIARIVCTLPERKEWLSFWDGMVMWIMITAVVLSIADVVLKLHH
jgi:hypothetical protein